MPKKLQFRVAFSTGWEDEYPPKDLEVHSPFIKGWRSPRYCQYPQEIVLRLDPAARVRKLQLLSHQYMITSKIDLYVGRLSSEGHSAPENAQYKRLGYISLSDNEQTGYRSRELKSVNLDCTGHFIKLVLQPNHVNRLNLFNQVSIVAVNVIGDLSTTTRVGVTSSLPAHISHFVGRGSRDPLSDVNHSYLPSVHHSHNSGFMQPVIKNKKQSSIPLLDDLGFAVAQDPQTANLIRALDTKKKDAVRDEEFEYAKHLKLVIDELQKIGEVLCTYEVEKKLAIEREDYDTAKEKKSQLEDIRKQVYEKLDIQSVLNSYPASSTDQTTVYSHPRVKKATFEADLGFQSFSQPSSSDAPVSLPPIAQPQFSPSNKPFYTEERPLPALVAKVDKPEPPSEDEVVQQLSAHEVSGESGQDPQDKPEPLTEKQLIKLPHSVEVFGIEKLEYIFSKQYYFREQGVQQVLSDLETREEGSKKEVNTTLRAVVEILDKVLHDKVMSTFSTGLELLSFIVGPFSEKHKLGRSELSFVVEKVVPVLLSRTGDTTQRIITASMNQISALAEHDHIKTFAMMGPMLIRPFKQKKPPWRLAQSRVELLYRFYQTPGLPSSGINYKLVMGFLNPLLSHPNGSVREPAIKLLMDLYKEYGNSVRTLLPVPDDHASRRKILWKTIFEGFDHIDGIPTQAEKEAARVAVQNAKAEEIQKLQGEVTALRQLAAQGGTMTEAEIESAVSPAPDPPTTAGQRGETSEPQSKTSETLDMTCVFCGEQRKEFADNGMESHYLQYCPMLQSCPYCSQVIEISGLTKHWLVDCEAKSKFKECSKCKEAVQSKQYEAHVASCKQGKALSDGHTLCPLCHTAVQDGEESWKAHLMTNGPKACVKNPRRKAPPARKIAASLPARSRGSGIPRLGGASKARTK